MDLKGGEGFNKANRRKKSQLNPIFGPVEFSG
jgi:hypothetical protein